jgi:RND superfamily putative drug exporter
MVSRFREELGAGRDVTQAVAVTMQTAGRTVLFSAVTVAVAMSSLTVFPLRFLQSMGIGGAVTALTAAAAALTLLPAAFVLFGGRLGRAVPGPANEGRWYRLAHTVLRRPGLVALVTSGALVACAIPALQTHWAGVDAHDLPAGASAHVVEDELSRGYRATASLPGYVAIRASAADGAAVDRYAGRLSEIPGLAVAAPRYVGDGTWELTTVTHAEAISTRAQQIVAAERAVPAPFTALVGGYAAEFHDQGAALASDLPLALAILALGTLFVLWLMTGSVVLPVKALAMNALTVGAATGILVLVFQDGRFTSLLDFVPQHGIEQDDYLVLAAIAFALSTDYGVFLLTRIKEFHDAGVENDEAVARGLQRTGGIVTAAAVLLAVAIGAFATSQIIFLKEIGIGAVAAVLIDAFIIRSLLVPALMGLLGPWNWWAPAALRRLHRRIGINEGAGVPPRPSAELGGPALQT